MVSRLSLNFIHFLFVFIFKTNILITVDVTDNLQGIIPFQEIQN
jgi:hypothetical protein